MLSNRFSHLEALKRAAREVPLLQVDEEIELARRAKAGDRTATQRLVAAHIRFVLAIADQYSRYGVAYDELVSEGLIGLMEAVNRFDPERGARLASYAAWWIRAVLRRFTLNNRRIVKAPSTRNARKVMAELSATRRELARSLGREPEIELVASELGVDRADIEEVDAMFRRRDVTCDSSPAPGNHEAVAHELSPEALAVERETQHRIDAAVRRGLASLTPRERTIVVQRALSDSPRRLSDLGEDLGISRERVRQVEQQSYAKLRGPLATALA